MAESRNHPYFPKDLVLENYKPNNISHLQILGVFFGVLSVSLVTTWVYSGTKPCIKNSLIARSKICWFVGCALIHMILEGYFSVCYKTIPEDDFFLAQLWKEYGKADSRYVSGDTFTVCMETITAFVDGPLAAFAAIAFLWNFSNRYIVQLILSLCQLYGDVLYFYTEIKDDFIHGDKFHPLYFWFYFFFMNILWIILPFLCIVESWQNLVSAQSLKDTRGSLNKKKST